MAEARRVPKIQSRLKTPEIDARWEPASLLETYRWKVPTAEDQKYTEWAVHQNQERRKDLLEAASQRIAEALTNAGKEIGEVINMLKEM